jgi:hypothetical protein
MAEESHGKTSPYRVKGDASEVLCEEAFNSDAEARYWVIQGVRPTHQGVPKLVLERYDAASGDWVFIGSFGHFEAVD